ncbi:hypothetical protein ABMA28_017228 [Loxostege sticticalis]|uniref:Integrase catalytic domain-containing protein n=1 Tax=Loxostege sticticalis TaxID=481309 RepID=A0ABD0S5W1_LOXSC
MLQDTWRLNVGWDDLVPEDIYKKWCQLDRYAKASKCRVLPVKPLTVPKAELQAAVLAARLAETIGKDHRLVPEQRFFWCDSSTVIHWIRNSTRKKTFEANRLGEIDELTRVSEWRYVPTKLNIADLATRESFNIDCNTMRRAECLLLKQAQSDSFSEELSALKDGKCVSRSSRLLTLCPIIDEQGLLRVGGRIDAAADVTLEMKRPIILDGRHPVARLIVRHYHVKSAHGCQETVVNELKQSYWIIKLRPTVKTVVTQCMFCRIRKCLPRVPRMGDLPEARLAHHQRPFTHCGLDLFGPLEVTVGRRREKRYGVLFTCLTVRAVHIELVASLSTDSLIMALRRMAARRGWPCHLYSDNGTNLRGAEKELKRCMANLDTDVLKQEGVNNQMDWHFIPPFSPHWGGAWERLIRSVKTSLKVVMTGRTPKEETLLTFLIEVENMVNSRPLSHVSVDPTSVESLTPNHFLLGTSSNLPTFGEFDDTDLHLRKQWRKAQRLADMFWNRWVREILPDMLPRKKWSEEQEPIRVGDLVLVVDPSSPRNTWPKGVIHHVYPGKDGRIRMLDVKTKTGIWRRSAARVAPIEVSI